MLPLLDVLDLLDLLDDLFDDLLAGRPAGFLAGEVSLLLGGSTLDCPALGGFGLDCAVPDDPALGRTAAG